MVIIRPCYAQSICQTGELNWPKGTAYCWLRRNTNGAYQNPGQNIFDPNNVRVNSAGKLIVKVKKNKTTGMITCGGVYLSKSLGLGTYEFFVMTSPTKIHRNLVASPFIYAKQDNEIDIEYTTWGGVRKDTIQYVIQPSASKGALKHFSASGHLKHRIKWFGTQYPNQVSFETYNGDTGQLIFSWTAQNGQNFVPGQERARINHWFFPGSNRASAASLIPHQSEFIVANFSFTPL